MKIIKFWAPWCTNCGAVSEQIQNIAKTNPTLSSFVESMQSVNIDTEDGLAIANMYRVRSLPTVIIVNDDQEEVLRYKLGESMLEFLEEGICYHD